MKKEEELQSLASRPVETVPQLDALLSEPTPEVIRAVGELEGDILILGAGGKVGPSMARMAAKAARRAGVSKSVIAVDRAFPTELEADLRDQGVQTLCCDLLDRSALGELPDAANVIYMAGRKFGSTGDERSTWAVNTYLAGLAAERFAGSRIVAFSTGNVYPLTRVAEGGATEDCQPAPVGEYAMSCLGRERILEHFSAVNGTPMVIFRLCYAVELRYGVVLDIAQKVWSGQPVDLSMGSASVIWQGDVCADALRSFALCQSPPMKINITGPETVSIRWLAKELGRHLGKEPVFEGQESETALVFNAARAQDLFGYPTVPLGRIVRWVAHWVKTGGPTLDKPTHFEQRDGKF